jgi:hypothetical protein
MQLLSQLMRKKPLEVSLEMTKKLISSYSDYPIFLHNPQLLNMIHIYA